MISLGTAIFIAFVVGSVLKIAARFYNLSKVDQRPFNWQYIKPIVGAVVTAFPAVIADFMLWMPPVGVESSIMFVTLAFMGGYGVSDGYKGILEYFGKIDKIMNKIGTLDDDYDGSS